MRTSRIFTPVCLSLLVLSAVLSAAPASGQSTDTAAERARLANERIQQEAQRRAEEERRRREREAAAEADAAASSPRATVAPGQQDPRPPAPTGARESVAAPASGPGPAADADRISRALQQLRDLGELRDAGYVTEEEFERIKARILESRF